MSQEQDYHRRRAETELRRAQDVRVPEAARAHQLLAGLHLERAQSTQERILSVVPDR